MDHVEMPRGSMEGFEATYAISPRRIHWAISRAALFTGLYCQGWNGLA